MLPLYASFLTSLIFMVPWSLQLRVFLIPRCISAQGLRVFCLIHRVLTVMNFREKNLSHVGEFDTLYQKIALHWSFFPLQCNL